MTPNTIKPSGQVAVKQTGPVWDTWPVIRGLAFVCADGGFLCCHCANGRNGSMANIDGDIKEAEKLRDQWRIVGAQFNPEDESCSHCAVTIPAVDSLWVRRGKDYFKAID